MSLRVHGLYSVLPLPLTRMPRLADVLSLVVDSVLSVLPVIRRQSVVRISDGNDDSDGVILQNRVTLKQ